MSATAPAQAFRIGILAHRPVDEARAYWQPLQTALEAALPDKRFELVLSDFARLDDLVDRAAVDLVLTNPNHYIQLRTRQPGMRAMATTIEEVQGQLLPLFGGVIVVRADRAELRSLADLTGRPVAAVNAQSLGGYRTQLYAFHDQGLPLPSLTQTLFTDMPHDNVIAAVLDGRVDAGFVRTGVIEEMAAAGRLDLTEIRLLNDQEVPGFPLRLSTRLYPQWAFAAMPGLDVEQVNRITAAALTLELPAESALRAAGLRFTVAVDYRAVEDLARALRLPPFEEIPRITVREFAGSHPVVSASVVAMILGLMVLALLLWWARTRLKEAAAWLERLVASVPVGLYEVKVESNGEPQLVFLSERGAALIGRAGASRDLTTQDFAANLHPDDLERFQRGNHEAIANRAPFDLDLRFRVGDQWRWLRVASNPLVRPDGVLVWSGSLMDVTEQRVAQQRLQDSEARFRTLLEDIEGVAVQGYGLDGSVIYWNRASEQLYGYSRDEAIGRNRLELIVPEEMRPTVRENLVRLAQGANFEAEELELQARDGRRIPVYSSHTVLRSPGQAPALFCLDIDLSERKRHEEELRKAANYDQLTGLPNRILLGELMRQAFARADRQGSALALCYLDLDHFKPVNEEYGVDVGNQVLAKVAERLRHQVRGGDVVARLGGDEFVLLLEAVGEQAQLRERLELLLDGVARPIPIDGASVQVAASMGVTLYPQDANDPDVLLRHASEAMFEAKRKGRRRFSLFDSKLEKDLEQRRQRQVELKNGLANNEFMLFFQPKIDMQTGKLMGLEALARWRHPSRGFLSPADFLDDLDGAELERRFGEYIVGQALAEIDRWNQIGFSWTVSVNISGAPLLDLQFAERLAASLQDFPSVQPAQLELEILETATVTRLDLVVPTLKRCRELGIRVALDDFGTGYSSLSRLRSLPVDILKIDQSFVRDMLADLSDYSIVKSVIGLAHAFNLDVIAEGVETHEHAAALLKLGCRNGQGYGFARPMPAEAVSSWLEAWQQGAAWQTFQIERLSAAETLLEIAANTHEIWLRRFKQNGSNASFGASIDAADHARCALGMWLHDEGRRLFGGRPEHAALLERHKDFHALAGQIADSMTKGQPVKPELERRLDQTSAELKRLIKALRDS